MKFILILIAFGVANVRALSFGLGEILAQNSTNLGELTGRILEDTLKLALDLDPDTGLSIDEFVDKYNYILESHEVITEDGYILTLHRIPHRKSNIIKEIEDTFGKNTTRPAVLLVHPISSCAASWFFQGPNASLAFQLVDEGYDVWLSNARGNRYSNQHVNLTTKDLAFWNFSFHEIGYYDLASNIDYILNVTKVDKITLIGCSQGNTAMTVLASSRPEYNEKVNLMAFLGPLVYLNELRSPIVRFVQIFNGLIKVVQKSFGIYAIQQDQFLVLVLNILCNERSPVVGLCIFLIELGVGFDTEQIDKSKLTVFFTFTPSGVSFKIVDHLLQVISTGEFKQFDYGDPGKNSEKYGSTVPPSYDLTQISTPVAVYYGKNDFIVGAGDVQRLVTDLKTEIADQYVIEQFNHVDYLTAKDVKVLLNDRLVEIVEKYNPLPGN